MCTNIDKNVTTEADKTLNHRKAQKHRAIILVLITGPKKKYCSEKGNKKKKFYTSPKKGLKHNRQI